MSNKTAIIVISSHVARGSVGNRASVFALEVLGHNVWAVPTVILPWHPGHGKATRIVASDNDFAALLQDLSEAPWLPEIGGILSGYLGNAHQASAIAKLVGKAKKINPELIYTCDPVIGDDTGLYVSEDTALAIRDILVPIADMITPNRFELAWICQHSPFETNDEILAAATKLSCPMTLITSAISMMRNSTGNILLSKNGALLAEHTMIENPPNGLGDLTSALLLARILQKMPMDKALQIVTASVFEILARAHQRKADELMLETDSGSLMRPMAMVQMRNLFLPKR